MRRRQAAAMSIMLLILIAVLIGLIVLTKKDKLRGTWELDQVTVYTFDGKGFRLYKQSAWQTFGGKSSTKNTHGLENQLMLDFEGKGVAKTHTDEFCFYIKDIAEYLQKSFNGQSYVPMSDVWALLDNHPIFPSDGFRSQIKKELKQNYGASVSRSTISFVDRS